MKQEGYETLRVTLPGCATPRVLFLKKHQPAVGEGTQEDGALFVAGVPFKLREGLQQLFSQFGTVEKVCSPIRFMACSHSFHSSGIHAKR